MSDSDSDYEDSYGDTGGAAAACADTDGAAAASAASTGDIDCLGKTHTHTHTHTIPYGLYFFPRVFAYWKILLILFKWKQYVPYLYTFLTQTADDENLDEFGDTVKKLSKEEQAKLAEEKLKKTFDEKGFKEAEEKFNLWK